MPKLQRKVFWHKPGSVGAPVVVDSVDVDPDDDVELCVDVDDASVNVEVDEVLELTAVSVAGVCDVVDDDCVFVKVELSLDVKTVLLELVAVPIVVDDGGVVEDNVADSVVIVLGAPVSLDRPQTSAPVHGTLLKPDLQLTDFSLKVLTSDEESTANSEHKFDKFDAGSPGSQSPCTPG
ncbi:unnamed protein product [Notodromas monacha]|uniref:Uncharacterized protein n=1 Tax=Notodromas monacha TaxID=399045 RepID=A0A7R9GGX7_9CRUS|nr:unnamed protein product [Notodromas monacha]CAG0922309.1 unnamed protein product [Notodromas monacha]